MDMMVWSVVFVDMLVCGAVCVGTLVCGLEGVHGDFHVAATHIEISVLHHGRRGGARLEDGADRRACRGVGGGSRGGVGGRLLSLRPTLS